LIRAPPQIALECWFQERVCSHLELRLRLVSTLQRSSGMSHLTSSFEKIQRPSSLELHFWWLAGSLALVAALTRFVRERAATGQVIPIHPKRTARVFGSSRKYFPHLERALYCGIVKSSAFGKPNPSSCGKTVFLSPISTQTALSNATALLAMLFTSAVFRFCSVP
jgi:hypothetical protein